MHTDCENDCRPKRGSCVKEGAGARRCTREKEGVLVRGGLLERCWAWLLLLLWCVEKESVRVWVWK